MKNVLEHDRSLKRNHEEFQQNNNVKTLAKIKINKELMTMFTLILKINFNYVWVCEGSCNP